MTTTIDLPTGYELPAELLAHQKELDDLVAKMRKTRASVDDLASQLPALDAEVQELTAKLAVRDADRFVAEDAEFKGLDAEIRKLADALDSKQRILNRTKNALIVQEARCPELDEQTQAAVLLLEQELIRYGDTALEVLRAELLEKVKPLQGVFAALTVLGVHTAGMTVRTVLAQAYLPDPKTLSFYLNSRMPVGSNLLAEQPEPEHAQLAEAMSAALTPIRASISAAKALGAYVPLDKRPKAYQRRGWTTEGIKGDQRPFGAPPAASPQRVDTVEEPSDESPLARASRALVKKLA